MFIRLNPGSLVDTSLEESSSPPRSDLRETPCREGTTPREPSSKRTLQVSVDNPPLTARRSER